MNFRSLKRAFVQITSAIVLLFAAFLTYFALSTHSARSKAEALCKTIPVGTDARTAETAIANVDTDSRLRFSRADYLGAGFYGAFMERWFCNVAVSSGKVVDNDVRLID